MAINEGDQYSSADGSSSYGYVTVLDAVAQKVHIFYQSFEGLHYILQSITRSRTSCDIFLSADRLH